MAAMVMVVVAFLMTALLLLTFPDNAGGAVPRRIQKQINKANKNGPYLGLVIPNSFEIMNPLVQHPSYQPTNLTIDFAGRRFRFGTIAGEKVVLVMTGLGMVNAGSTTQLLLSLFDVKGVVHYGIAGNANPNFGTGDVLIPQYWAQSSLWSGQMYGSGPENELPLETSGDFPREFGFLRFADYTTNATEFSDDLLNHIWYQPEEIFPVDGTTPDEESLLSN